MMQKTQKVTVSDNDKYYTHPAFTNGEEELTGIWVSKYELSGENEEIISKPLANVLVNKSLDEYYQSVSKMGNNYHIIKNTEWGAIAYLGQSKYGLCSNNKCMNIKIGSLLAAQD